MQKLTAAMLIAEANKAIRHITVGDARKKLNDPDFVFVDVRDSAELAAGRIPGVVHAQRGGLEFALDPESGMAVDALVSGKTLIMICGSGGRAALATKLALEFGRDARCLEGGMKAWIAAAAPVVKDY